MTHKTFITTSRGLQRTAPAMRLYEKAKKLGIWNPSDLDFSQDKADWQRLNHDEQDLLLRLTAMFQAGEEAVTLDLLPLIMVIAQENRLEEEIYLTTFLFE
jgi:ribonucleoside-diphosphate reductase beta chain